MNSKEKWDEWDGCQRQSTSGDSSSGEDEFYCKTNPLKHKTQLCKTYSELGYCNYGDKCRFAHGRHQLIHLPINNHFRSRKCNGYWRNGSCLYGLRCQFGHAQIQWQDKACLLAMQANCQSYIRPSRLLGLLN